MSRGPGRIQRLILDHLERVGGWAYLGDFYGGLDGRTRSRIESLRRAVKSLEAAGFVETRYHPDGVEAICLQVRRHA